MNNRIKKFTKNNVDLKSTSVSTGRSSRNNLLSKISSKSDDLFFPLYNEKSMGFGSFSRNTKACILDDIDHLVCIKSQGALYSYTYNTYTISAPDIDIFKNCLHDNSNNLNSRKVIERLKSCVNDIPECSKAEIKRNLED